MHFEILVEDQSGKTMLEILVPKLLDKPNTYKIISYKGIGRIPKDMRDTENASNRILLENLPKLLKGYGRTYTGAGNYQAVVFVICDLDDKCMKAFKEELNNILRACNPEPETRFCFAVEEGEAWFLGDLNAIRAAYPKAKDTVLTSYTNDSICGTWEKLADAVYPGGAVKLKSEGYQAIGMKKSEWAKEITPRMNIDHNTSPSFNYFKDKILSCA